MLNAYCFSLLLEESDEDSHSNAGIEYEWTHTCLKNRQAKMKLTAGMMEIFQQQYHHAGT